MEGQAPKSLVTGVPGWLTDQEEALIARYASNLGSKGVFVGIGVEYGRSMAAVAYHTHSKHVYGVELYPKPEYDINLKEAGYHAHITILEGDSSEVGSDWSKGDIDLLFIDGDHSYEGAARDIAAWTPHVKVGGFVLFHDVAQPTNSNPHYLHFEVTRAITAWLGETVDFQAVEQVDSIAVFKRIGESEVKPHNPKSVLVTSEGVVNGWDVKRVVESDPTLPLIPDSPSTELAALEEVTKPIETPAKNKPGRKPAKK